MSQTLPFKGNAGNGMVNRRMLLPVEGEARHRSSIVRSARNSTIPVACRQRIAEDGCGYRRSERPRADVSKSSKLRHQ